MAKPSANDVDPSAESRLPTPEEALAMIAAMVRQNTGLEMTPMTQGMVLFDNVEGRSEVTAELVADGKDTIALVLRATSVMKRCARASTLADLLNKLPAMGIALAGEQGSLWMCTRYSVIAPATHGEIILALSAAEYALRLALPMLLLPSGLAQGDAALVELRAGWFRATSPWETGEEVFVLDALRARGIDVQVSGRELHTATPWGWHGARAASAEHFGSLTLTTQAAHPVVGCGLSWRMMPPTIWPTSEAAMEAASSLNQWEWRDPTGPPTLGAWFVNPDEPSLIYMGTAFAGLYDPSTGLSAAQVVSWADTRAFLAYGRLAAAGLLPYEESVEGFDPIGR